MLLVKNWQFFHLFNIGKIAHHSVFKSILEKKAFPDYKKNKLKIRQIAIFPKALVHGFG